MSLLSTLTYLRTWRPNVFAFRWTDGPHMQFGISSVLCEGASHAKTKELNQASGVVIAKSLAEYYRGERQ